MGKNFQIINLITKEGLSNQNLQLDLEMINRVMELSIATE